MWKSAVLTGLAVGAGLFCIVGLGSSGGGEDLAGEFADPLDRGSAADVPGAPQTASGERKTREAVVQPSRTRRAARSLTGEQRRLRADWLQAVSVSSLGVAPPGVDVTQLGTALHLSFGELGDCIEQLGGFGALYAAALGTTARQLTHDERRRLRRVSIEIEPDGHIDPSGVAIDPPIPAPFDGCFADYFSSPELGVIGSDGARVEFPLRGFRRRGPPDAVASAGAAAASWDAGVSF